MNEDVWPAVSEIADRVRSGSVSASSLVRKANDRIAALDDRFNAMCTVTPGLAEAQAAHIDDRVGRGDVVGPLAGVPYAVKDLINTEGVRTTSGSVAYRDFVPDEDDIVVERCRAAGAVSIGKTNASEFGYSATGQNPLFPTTRNPWNTALTPGGSSAGTAAAVAGELVPFALGSDGGGSIRIPAAFCGLVGFKASMGRVPVYPGCRDERFPGASGWESVEHIGPLCRTVADVVTVMKVLAGPDPRDRHSIPTSDVEWEPAVGETVRGLRVALSLDFGYLAVDPEIRTIVGRAVETLRSTLGCEVTTADPGWPEPGTEFAALIMSETDLTGMRAMVDEVGDQMSPHLVELVTTDWTAEDFTHANMWRKAVVNRMARFMADHDVLITPTTSVAAFPVGVQGPTVIDGRSVTDTAWQGFTFPANLSGQPAISVPAGLTSTGLPVGMQIIGRHLDDATVLRLASAWESTAGFPEWKPSGATHGEPCP
ncbi:amidase [Williamsia sterculiae]|uniref:amidase n=1 Tax=Williamsia sterculiae TaxID=1344003 RepID=A0A1N7GIB4_9NOCA|nr:amidase [Williamsia sterculiae]SIS12266.1 aspartyl-tRNA(Asn)/glutamyl-tRNA(Gln) amidotransferase subunit A [Williamsia sterculiae]